MLKKKILTTDEEYKFYAEGFKKSLGSTAEKTKEISFDYFRRSLVVGYFDGQTMVSGYILCDSKPLRLLEFVPEIPKDFDFDQCQEIVCLWKNKSVSKHVTHKTLWPDIMTDFLNSERKFLLGHTQSEKLYKHYDLMSSTVLYEGPSVFNLPSRLFYYTRFQAYALRISSYLLSFYYFFKR